MTKNENDFSYDDILQEIGMFGPYQIFIYILLILPIMFVAMSSAQYVFNAGAVEHRCKVPECEKATPKWNPGSWGAWTLPDDKRRRCHRLAPREPRGPCKSSNFDSFGTTVQCKEWIYKTHHSIVAEFDLACSEWKRTLIGTVHGAGVFFALPCVGYISDTIGRRSALVMTAVAGGVMGLIRSLSTTYAMYLTFEFLDAFLGSGSFQSGYVLALEMVNMNWRVCFGSAAASSFALGQVAISLIAWHIPNWRTLTRLVYFPTLFFFFYHFLIEESARWLLSKGRKAEAAKIVFRFAKWNDKELSPELVKYLKEEKIANVEGSASTSVEREKSLFKKVIGSRAIVGRLVVCSFWWVAVTLVYYGLSVNSVTLAGIGHLNFVLTALVEIPGYLLSILTLDRFGRKRCMMVAFFSCGIALFIMPFVPNSNVALGLTLLGKLCISMVFGSLYIYTIELFPTEGRASLMAVCSTVGRIGAMAAPQTPLLLEIMPSLPYLLFGAVAACAGVLMTLTPETVHMPLPDTMEQAEAIDDKATREKI